MTDKETNLCYKRIMSEDLNTRLDTSSGLGRCPVCDGKGYVPSFVPNTHRTPSEPYEYKVENVPCPSCNGVGYEI